MAIVAGDILTKLSVTTGPGNSTAQADADLSLGEFMSSTTWTGGTAHDLFDIVTGPENAASTVDYRCIFYYNTHSTLTAQNFKVFIASQVSGGTAIAIGADPAGVKNYNSATAQAAEISVETDAPAGVSFSSPGTYATGISLGNIGPSQCAALWIRRTAANTSAVDDDGATLTWQCDTAA